MKASRTLGILLVLAALSVLQLQAAETGSFQKTLQVSGPVDMEVVSGSGNINVHTGNAANVYVSARIRARDSWFGMSAQEKVKKLESNPPIEQQGNSIHIGRIDDRDLQQNVSIDYDVTVPPQTKLLARTGSGDETINGLQLPLTAKTGSGNITIDNMGAEVHTQTGSGEIKVTSVKGALNVSTGSGNIHARGIAGETVANTGSGEIEVEQVAAGNVRVGTGSGNIRLRGVKGSLRVDTGSGDIQAEGDPTGDWRVGAGSGNIHLKLPSQASFNVDARTSSGTLKVNRNIATEGSTSKKHLLGKVGNGGVLLDLHTGSGDIQVD
jgi:DUF4097 and DUF4098 domain-containing protein YvlB